MKVATVRNAEVKKLIEKLLDCMQEEDIGLSLFTTHYQDKNELSFFREEDQVRVGRILKRLCEDSKRHKKVLGKIIVQLEKKLS